MHCMHVGTYVRMYLCMYVCIYVYNSEDRNICQCTEEMFGELKLKSKQKGDILYIFVFFMEILHFFVCFVYYVCNPSTNRGIFKTGVTLRNRIGLSKM